MSYVQMTIDSVRHAMHRDEWLILLKGKDGHRCLPVYVDKVWADAVGKVLRGEDTGLPIDDEVEKVVVMGSEATLVIDRNGDSFKARFVGQGDEHIECSVGKGLAMAARGGVKVLFH